LNKLKIGFIVVGVLLIINLTLTGINILQNGLGGWDGRSVGEILGVPAEQANIHHIEMLSKSEVMQLFLAAPAPELGELNGEYFAKPLPLGILAPAADYYTHHFFGPGRWKGKAFHSVSAEAGEGYNIFARKQDRNAIVLSRTRKLKTYIGKSNIDDKNSFHLDYSPFNSGLVHSMHDEIRKINDTLYLGMGYMGIGGGSINPAPFVIYGRIGPWVGAQE